MILDQETVIGRPPVGCAQHDQSSVEAFVGDGIGDEVLVMSRKRRRIVGKGVGRLDILSDSRRMLVLMIGRMVAVVMMRFREIVRHGRAQRSVHTRQQNDQ